MPPQPDTGKPRSAVDWPALRARLADQHGPRYWRSLEEIADSDDFRAYVEAEFPEQAPHLLDPVGRRSFLKLMGASLALAGVSACTRQPTEKVFPYVKAPELIVPGVPLYFATAMALGGVATGVLAESHMGRPTKIEGNPDHPASLGATDLFAQASVLGLYDPDRSQVIRHVSDIQTWATFSAALGALMEAQKGSGGARLRILTGTVTSPTLAHQLDELLAQYPQATWHQYEPVSRDAIRAAAQRAFGRPLATQYRFDKAARVLSLDADFLGGSGPGQVRYIRDFIGGRQVDDGQTMNRLYVVESTPSNTGARADHRLPLRPAEIVELAVAVARAVGVPGRAAHGVDAHAKWIDAVVRDLQAHRGASLVVAGDYQPESVHLLAHAINQALGNVGTTVVYTEPVEARPIDQTASLRELAAAMDAGSVDVLVMLDVNPLYDAPADLDFGGKLAKVGTRIHYGLYDDETAQLSHWHVPATHYLEAWSDARAYDGTVTIVQPLIAPLYDGKTAHELLAALLGQADATGYDLVRAYWKTQLSGDFEAQWRKAVHDGVIAGTALPAVQPSWARPPSEWGEAVLPVPGADAAAMQLLFRPDHTVYDGRFANNGWLQEVPKPVTKLTWDNVALLAPATAERLRVANEDVIELTVDGRTVRAPVWVQPGQAPDVVTLQLGYGRRRAGQVGTGIGVDAYALRTSAQPWTSAVTVSPTGGHYPLSCTQHHHSMEGRELVRSATLDEFRADPRAFAERDISEDSMYPPFAYNGYAWGMTVDLNACVGCNACVVACVSENNIPVVGKDQVGKGREMQWIRIDRYFEGDLDNPATHHQPVFCQHCELAPCETVCPVNATVHDSEGLNAMVYNRCVGTRYCSNNCPYKVRRFNFTLYNHPDTDTLKMLQNPDVTVRSRGVMEKCTYCVQRINFAKVGAAREDREVRDGEIVTACQQACPASALTFGNINDPASRVTRLKATPRNYRLLNETGTRPRTTYLASLRNPNPELERRA